MKLAAFLIFSFVSPLLSADVELKIPWCPSSVTKKSILDDDTASRIPTATLQVSEERLYRSSAKDRTNVSIRLTSSNWYCSSRSESRTINLEKEQASALLFSQFGYIGLKITIEAPTSYGLYSDEIQDVDDDQSNDISETLVNNQYREDRISFRQWVDVTDTCVMRAQNEILEMQVCFQSGVYNPYRDFIISKCCPPGYSIIDPSNSSSAVCKALSPHEHVELEPLFYRHEKGDSSGPHFAYVTFNDRLLPHKNLRIIRPRQLTRVNKKEVSWHQITFENGTGGFKLLDPDSKQEKAAWHPTTKTEPSDFCSDGFVIDTGLRHEKTEWLLVKGEDEDLLYGNFELYENPDKSLSTTEADDKLQSPSSKPLTSAIENNTSPFTILLTDSLSPSSANSSEDSLKQVSEFYQSPSTGSPGLPPQNPGERAATPPAVTLDFFSQRYNRSQYFENEGPSGTSDSILYRFTEASGSSDVHLGGVHTAASLAEYNAGAYFTSAVMLLIGLIAYRITWDENMLRWDIFFYVLLLAVFNGLVGSSYLVDSKDNLDWNNGTLLARVTIFTYFVACCWFTRVTFGVRDKLKSHTGDHKQIRYVVFAVVSISGGALVALFLDNVFTFVIFILLLLNMAVFMSSIFRRRVMIVDAEDGSSFRLAKVNHLVKLFTRIIGAAFFGGVCDLIGIILKKEAKPGNTWAIILTGFHIGTVLLRNAALMYFLTCRPLVRERLKKRRVYPNGTTTQALRTIQQEEESRMNEYITS